MALKAHRSQWEWLQMFKMHEALNWKSIHIQHEHASAPKARFFIESQEPRFLIWAVHFPEKLPNKWVWYDEVILLMEEILHQLIRRIYHYSQMVQDFLHQQHHGNPWYSRSIWNVASLQHHDATFRQADSEEKLVEVVAVPWTCDCHAAMMMMMMMMMTTMMMRMTMTMTMMMMMIMMMWSHVQYSSIYMYIWFIQ